MIVAFMMTGDAHRAYAERMVASVKEHMPTVPIVHLHDPDTATVRGATAKVQLLDIPLMLYRLRQLTDLDGDVLSLDSDIIVQQDLRPVFHKSFDVALTKRDSPIISPNGDDVAKMMPYNGGVIFCRRHAFWQRCYELVKRMPADWQKWWGDQIALRIAAPEFDTLELPCATYNYTPGTEDEDVSARALVHYKGNRKDWMLRRESSLSQTTPA